MVAQLQAHTRAHVTQPFAPAPVRNIMLAVLPENLNGKNYFIWQFLVMISLDFLIIGMRMQK